MTADRPEPPPESTLLRQAYESSPYTIPQLASAAGVSPSTVSIVFQGFKYHNKTAKPIRPKAQTVADMAAVLSIDPSRLIEAGRPDAAELMVADPSEPSAAYTAGRRDLADALLKQLSAEEILSRFTTHDLQREIDRRSS